VFAGAYSTFRLLREFLQEHCRPPPQQRRGYDLLLNHSGCGGELTADECSHVLHYLLSIMPRVKPDEDLDGRVYSVAETLHTMIEGLQVCVKNGFAARFA
jgi:hypothetical protein